MTTDATNIEPEPDVAVDDEAWLVPAPAEPLAVARLFLEEQTTETSEQPLLRSHRGVFHGWTGSCWPELEERQLRSDLYTWLERASYERVTSKDWEILPWAPTSGKIANVIDALHAATHLSGSVNPPAWLDGREDCAAEDVIPLANGLLNIHTRTLIPHTPAFFVGHSLPFDFDPDAPPPQKWHAFLRELWSDDDASIDSLAELMGYLLSGETHQQKIFGLVGPKRSGKGTIGRVLTGLLGAHNVVAPTLAGLTSNFGLSPLIGKPLAIISDARLSTRADSMVAVERLLSISGEDALTIDRKYLAPWTGRLPTRFLILTNELPRFTDASGALASRFVLLVLRESFYGREDPTLTGKLLQEAPGIFNWALAGLDRLLERGHFAQPATAREALRQLEDLSSPIGAFVRDLCIVGPVLQISKDALYDAWKRWCDEEGRTRTSTKAVFVRDLRAAVPGLTPIRPRDGEHRRHLLQGIDLRANQPRSTDTPATTGSSANNRNRPLTTPTQPLQQPLADNLNTPYGQGSEPAETAQASPGQGWAGVETTVARVSDVLPDEIERLAELSRRYQQLERHEERSS